MTRSRAAASWTLALSTALLGFYSGISAAQTPPAAPEALSEVAIRGIRPRRDISELRVSAEQARAQPGTHDDPVKVIENLPGLARAAFGSDQLVLWGAAPEDSRVYVDGVEIPQLFHGSGIRSTINGDLLSSVSLSPGAYGADYGRAIGGMVRLETRELEAGYHATVDASTLDASARVTGPLGERMRLSLGARYGLLDRTLSAVDAPDIGDFFAVPRYHDYQAKLQVRLRDRESLDVVALGSSDELDRLLSSDDPARVRTLSTAQSFERVYLRYRRALEQGGSVEVVPWFGRDESRYDARFGEIPAQLAQQAVRFGLRAEQRSRLASNVVLCLGLDAAGTRANLERRGTLTLPAREGDLTVFGQPPGDDDSTDSWQATIVDVAPYASVDWTVGPLTLSRGYAWTGICWKIADRRRASVKRRRLGARRSTPKCSRGSARATARPSASCCSPPRVCTPSRPRPPTRARCSARPRSVPKPPHTSALPSRSSSRTHSACK